MKKLLILCVVLCLAGCSYEISLKGLKETYPKAVKETIEELSMSVQKKLMIPQELPFNPNYVRFSYAKENSLNKIEKVSRTEFLFSAAQVNFHIVHRLNPEQDLNETAGRTIKIKGRETAVKHDNSQIKQLEWEEEDGSTITLSMIISREAEGKYTLSDLVDAAKSMYE
ncbi:hypothetical protein [Halobacillus ihumii]|uniref:hypothetical protein n=1 Tax=Halobacillus ihumii TaxID=2686092 RepID=UPI0013D35E05|nr:hypothetical protein [Halobacillus ihumii]